MDLKISPRGMAQIGLDSQLTPRGTDNGSNIQSENVRKPLETLKQNVIATGRRHSIIDLDVEKSDARRSRVLLQEKDKQLMFLEQQLLITQARVEELQAGSDKSKRQEREAKKVLSSRESDLRRQTVALKQTNDKLQCFVVKDESKIRRSKMERMELQEELERMEEEYGEQLARNSLETRSLEDLIVNMRDETSALLADRANEFHLKSAEMAGQFAAELSSFSDAVAQLTLQTTSLMAENSNLHSQVG